MTGSPPIGYSCVRRVRGMTSTRAGDMNRSTHLRWTLQGLHLEARPWQRPQVPQPLHLHVLMLLNAQAKQLRHAIHAL